MKAPQADHYRWDAAGRLIEMGPPQPSTSDPPGDDGRCSGPGCPPPPPPPPDPDPPLDNGRSSGGGFKSQSAGTVSYEYDYQDRRVVKDEGGSGRLYFWDEVLGKVIWEFPLEAPASQDVVRGFLNGRLVVENDTRPGGGLHYFHRDHLGTSKLMTDFFSGAAVCDETYHPFGQVQSEQPSGCNAHSRKFTGKERDPESGLDYFGARYCDSVAGRFFSTDPSLESADPANPQTWNRYSYSFNNPMIFVDPDGENPRLFQLLDRLSRSPAARRAIRFVERQSARLFNSATRFFNSQGGQELTQAAFETVTGSEIPNSTVASAFKLKDVGPGLLGRGSIAGILPNGADLDGRFVESGGQLIAAVAGAFNPKSFEEVNLGTLLAIRNGIGALARSLNLKSVKVQAVGVINEGLEEFLRNQGFKKVRMILEDGSEVVVFEKTIEVP